jgi:hypothetical protein
VLVHGVALGLEQVVRGDPERALELVERPVAAFEELAAHARVAGRDEHEEHQAPALALVHAGHRLQSRRSMPLLWNS